MPPETHSELFRQLPSVDELLRHPELANTTASEGHPSVAEAARVVLANLRSAISAGHLKPENTALAIEGLPRAVERQLRESLEPSLRPVINATGVILHTNLGRAPLAAAALERAQEIASGYSTLEFDLESGERGKRDVHTDRLFAKLFSQQLGEAAARLSTIVVNNNAAAVLLALNAIAESGEAIVSRGELVEIGGSFRIPEVMSKAGVTLREVGTTNRTRIADYERAITEKTRVLLRVHRSNFQMVGFTEQPSLEELVALGRKHKVPVLEDLGSGALLDLRLVGVNGEPSVADSLRHGVDVVTYSGDKLLGGPQAGILSGKRELITRIRQNALFRALRVDKLIYGALETTLLAYVRHDFNSIPALQMMQLSAEKIRLRAEAVRDALEKTKALALDVVAGESVIGGGAAPGATLPTFLLAASCRGISANELAKAFRSAKPLPIVARVEDGRVLLDLRTVLPEHDSRLNDALRRIAETAS